MKSLFFLLRRYKLASFLNFVGIVLAFTGCYILFTQIDYIGNYNQGIKDYKNIRRLYCKNDAQNGWIYTFNRPFLDKLSDCPQVESIGFLRSSDEMAFDKEGSVITAPSYVISDNLLITLNAQAVDGKLAMQAHETGIVIPASLAETYFGNVMAAGKQMKFQDGNMVNVIGVYKDFPENSDISNAVYQSLGDENRDNFANWSYSAYIRTRADVDEETINSTLRVLLLELTTATYGDFPRVAEQLQTLHIVAMSLSDTYFNGYDPETDRGSKTTFFILQLAVVLLLSVALINFANFSLAQAPIRFRCINTRKVMGESNISIRLHLVAEGIAVSLFAFVVSLVLIHCISLWKHIGEYTLGTIALSDHGGALPLMAAVSVGVGILSTIYSAYYVTSFQPALVLRGSFGLSPRGRGLRQWLIGFQLALAFILIVFVSVIYCQNAFILSSDYGFEKDALLFGKLNTIPTAQKEALRGELEGINGVEAVSYSGWPLGLCDKCMTWTRNDGGEDSYSFSVIPVDWKMLRTCGIDVVEGRDFKETDGDVYIINEAMKRMYPKLEPDKPLCEGELTVVGVCRDFRAFSTRVDNKNKPVAFVIFGERFADWKTPCFLYVRLAADADREELTKKIGRVLKSFANDDAAPEMKFQDERMKEAYHDEMRFMAQIEVSTLLTLIIGIIGVFCLTMFETECRRKEIGIRKVMGSGTGEVLALFASRYTWPLVGSFIVAAPTGYYVSEQWLQNFAERTPIHWWIFPAAFAVVCATVLTTVVVQSWRVATMNPVESIRTE